MYSVPAILGSVITYMFGGWTQLLQFLLILMALDYLTGIIATLKEKTGLNSEIGFWGLIKKTLMLLSVFIGHQIDLSLGLTWCMSGCVYFWLANELVSIGENYGRIGLKMPTPLLKAIRVLKDKTEDETKKDENSSNTPQ